MRPGYSPDEEFTVIAVRGIAEHGLPLLPSGLLYDRGILYSYASWFVHALTGSELPAYRALSFTAALIALWLVYKLVARIRNPMAGVLSAAIVATSIPFWATATSARFYAPFFALYLATLLSLSNAYLLVVFAFLSRLTHELAFTLAAVPVICWFVDREHRVRWLRATIAIIVGLVLGQLLLLLLHWMSPTTGDTMVRRFFLWQVLNLFERPAARQFGIPLVAIVIAWLAAPKHAWTACVIGLSIAVAIFAFSIAQASNTVPLSAELIRNVSMDGSRYPLDMFWHIARTTPLTLIAALTMMGFRMSGLGGEWRLGERGFHALWVGWVLWFGVIESGITTNYLLLPMSFMLMAIAVDLYQLSADSSAPARRYFSNPSRAAWAGLSLVLVLVAADQWRHTSFDAARPTIVADGIDDIRNGLKPNDRVVCTDELGCLMLVGRIDRWLALDDYVRERFLVRRGDGPITGVYTGVPAVFRPAELFTRNSDGSLPDRVVIVDIFKDYPIGNSRTWLPKAIEQDGVKVTPLLETPQLRVLEVSDPEGLARLR